MAAARLGMHVAPIEAIAAPLTPPSLQPAFRAPNWAVRTRPTLWWRILKTDGPEPEGVAMKPPLIQGEIERRLLINYRVDPEVMARHLPAPFEPHLVDGAAVAGICLIRLGGMRIKGLPRQLGLRSENAAHRVAVEWESPQGRGTGVYIPRRDSDSMVNRAAGGRLYPGLHFPATFRVQETPSEVHVAYTARDGSAEVDVAIRVVDELEGSAIFRNVAEASAFFERGAVGFSATRDSAHFDGLELRTAAWKVEPAVVIRAHSSYFDDRTCFPAGSVVLDSALIMREVPVTWAPLPKLRATR
jgi:hypothetical protein